MDVSCLINMPLANVALKISSSLSLAMKRTNAKIPLRQGLLVTLRHELC